MGRDIEVEDATAVMCKYDKNEQNLEPDGVYGEEVYRSELRHMIVEERFPCLGWRFSIVDHVLGDGRLGQIYTELQKFAVNSGRAPEWVIPTYGADQVPSLL
jgi:hypothetical protein